MTGLGLLPKNGKLPRPMQQKNAGRLADQFVSFKIVARNYDFIHQICQPTQALKRNRSAEKIEVQHLPTLIDHATPELLAVTA